MQVDIEKHPIKVGDKVVYNTGKHDSGVRIGVVLKLLGTTKIEVEDTSRKWRDVRRKDADSVYVIK